VPAWPPGRLTICGSNPLIAHGEHLAASADRQNAGLAGIAGCPGRGETVIALEIFFLDQLKLGDGVRCGADDGFAAVQLQITVDGCCGHDDVLERRHGDGGHFLLVHCLSFRWK
jgi:hypothetical protein